MPPYSPRSGTQKFLQTGTILGLFALAIPAGLQALRDFASAPVSPDLEIKLTAFLMAAVGTGLKSWQHKRTYGTWWGR